MKTKSRRYCVFRKYYLINFLLCTALSSSSQIHNYQFRFIGLPENFRSQFITLLDEDAAGMLWFVTNNGLHRYDGNQVLTFDMQSKPSLPDININCLFADSHSNLWIATRKKLVCFDLKKWNTTIIPFPESPLSTPVDKMITSITEGKDGSLYFGSANGNVFSYTNNNLHFILQLLPLNKLNNHTNPSVSTIQELDKGQLWITTDQGQVVHVSLHQDRSAVYYNLKEFQNTGINSLAFGKSGKCLVYADEAGAYLFDTTSRSLTPLTTPLPFASLKKSVNYAVALNNEKVVFFFSGASPDPKGFAAYDFADSSFKNLNAIYPASFKTSIFRKIAYKNGTIYISTDRGIAAVSYSNNPFYISGAELENINSIRTIYKQPDGQLFIGSYKERFTLLNEHTNETKPLSEEMVSCLIPWGRDSLLAGTEGRFPMWYFPSANHFEPVLKKNSPADNYRIDNHVVCLCKENDTLVWAGTYAGCYLFNPLTGAIIKPAWTVKGDALQQLNVTDILKAGSNRYFATFEGIFKYNVVTGVITRLFENTDSVYANARYNCLRLIGNSIWAGTNGNGILVFDTSGTIQKKITAKDGLASNIIFSLPADGGYIFVGTSKGLSSIQISSGAITSYSSQHYLPSNEFNRSAWFVDGDTVFMGTTNGLIRFTVSSLKQYVKELTLQLKLTSLSLNNGNETVYDYSYGYSQHPSLTIPAGTKSFSLSFGTLDEAAAEMNLFYRFENDSTWQNIGSKKELTFVSLPPGEYNIQIAAQLPDGQRTKNLFRVPVTVRPMFYQTIWFKIILAFALVLLLTWIIKRRETMLRKEQQLRSRIAGDLHDEVGSALTRIYFQADKLSPTAAQSKDTAEQSPLQKIVAGSQEALSSMSDMVWSIDAHYDNASDMVGRMKDYIARLQDELDCHCRFEVSGDYEKRYMAQVSRQNVFLIFKEAVTNALKYGLSKKAEILLVFEQKLLLLKVKNEKAVLSNSNPAQGSHGLKNMQLRADKINGLLKIENNEKDFIITLTVKQ